MANKTANVNARVEENVKKKAEDILSAMGIPASVGINMFYRQVIYCHGLPFRPYVPENGLRALSEMTKEEFDSIYKDSEEILKLLASITKTTSDKIKK